MSQVRRLSGVVLFGLSLFAAAPLAAQEIPWRSDYNAARKEAKEKNKPILLDVGTTPCCWCDKLDATTFRDPAVVKVLTDHFIPVKINAVKDPKLVQALGIDSFPTLLFAAPNGKIVAQQDGYLEAVPLRRQLDRLVVRGDETNVQDGDRTRLLLAAEKLTDALGNTYLELADSLQRKGQLEQALSYLEKTVRTCPGTQPAQLAQERMYQLKERLARQSEDHPVIRGQAP